MTQLSRAPRVRPRLRAALVVTGVVVSAAAAAFAGVAAPAAASGRPAVRFHPARTSAVTSAVIKPAALIGQVHYAVSKPLCAQPASPGAVTCAALRRVTVPAGTPGAYPYVAPAYKHGPAGGLTPADLAKAYGYDPGLHRGGQTVALVNWYDDPHAHADLDRFDKHYGLPKETPHSFRKVNGAGHAAKYPKADRESAGETSLDIETVRAVCHTCHILLVEAKAPTMSSLAQAENTAARLGATEISNSYGAPEHKVPAHVRKAFDHPGIVITASTGDDGWYDWDAVDEGVASPGRASYPSTDPHVVAVGGTTLQLTSNGTRAAETVWNSNGADDSVGAAYRTALGASGGGCSKYLAAGAWQRKHAGYAAAGCGGKRLAADVSADADPATGFDVINTFHERGLSKWETLGGTSLSSPLVAAMYALAGGAHGSAYPAASLYLNATTHPSRVYDVTQGGNSFCGGDDTATCSTTIASETDPSTNNPNGFGGVTDCSFPRGGRQVTTAPAELSECNATTGYDGASGVGAPKTPAFFHPTDAHLTIKHQSHVTAHHRTSLTAKVVARIKGLHATSFSWTFGDGAGAGGSHPGVHHTYKKNGTYRVTLRVTDTSGQVSVTHATVRVR